MVSTTATATIAMCIFATCAHAELAVSANDGKQLRAGEGPLSRTADTVAIIDLARGQPRLLGIVDAPASLAGPPNSVAVARDESFALVSGGQKLDTATPPAIVDGDALSVIDLADPAAPRIVQSLQAGRGAGAVALKRDASLALVVGTADDTISVFSISKKRLALVDRIQLPSGSKPVDIAITPDGKSALVVAQGVNKVLRLAIRGARVSLVEGAFSSGIQPVGLAIDRQGRFAFNATFGGRPLAPGEASPSAPRPGGIGVLDLKTGKVIDYVEAGATPENVTLTADGAFMQVTVINGSSSSPTSRNYNEHGLLKVYGVKGGQLSLIAQAPTGQWCQGGVWSRDGRTLLLQCAARKEIEIYRFDGKLLVRDATATIALTARPGGFATAWSR